MSTGGVSGCLPPCAAAGWAVARGVDMAESSCARLALCTESRKLGRAVYSRQASRAPSSSLLLPTLDSPRKHPTPRTAMLGTPALLFRSSLAAPSIASKARKFKPPISTPASHAHHPPAHPPQPAAWIPPTGEAGAAQGTLSDASRAAKAHQSSSRAIPLATPFDAPRGAGRPRRDEYREPPAVEAARKKSVAERNVWESYLGACALSLSLRFRPVAAARTLTGQSVCEGACC